MQLKLKSYALYLLSRREHSWAELKKKLLAKKYSEAEVAQLLVELVAGNLQSDERFTEVLVRTRINHGVGPLRIRDELASHHIDDNLINKYFIPYQEQDQWVVLAEKARYKKFGSIKLINSLPQQIKQKKYLHYKGFDFATIKRVFKDQPKIDLELNSEVNDHYEN